MRQLSFSILIPKVPAVQYFLYHANWNHLYFLESPLAVEEPSPEPQENEPQKEEAPEQHQEKEQPVEPEKSREDKQSIQFFRPKHWGMAKIYDLNSPSAPYFPKSYEIVKSVTFNV